MRIAILTANTGGIEGSFKYEPQSKPCSVRVFDDKSFPPRAQSMTPRLQARIPKMFGWQMAPGYDLYIWVDSSHSIISKNFVEKIVDLIGEGDFLLFKHPQRKTVKEEADYIRSRLEKSCTYITPRYKGELIDEQLAELNNDKGFVDTMLFASTVVAYRPTDRAKMMLKEWWYHTSRYHSVDQLSLPYVVQKSGCTVTVCDWKAIKGKHLAYVRKK